MTSIDDIILKSINPFDNYRSVNFWHKQQPEPTIESIHQEAIATIEQTLNRVAQSNRTCTLLLDGDPGSGKTHLLGRLKEAFNSQAFFAYINPFPQSNQIWQHILRYIVDSLVQVPTGQQDSQLLLWLKSVLSFLKQRSVKDRIVNDDVWDLLRSDRRKFINKLKDTYKLAGIYNADSFFGVLHDLINPELYSLACEWLRGDDLSEESLQKLNVKSSIQTEEAARETIANFSRIATNTQPIVLCFDQLESIARLPDSSLDLQTLFSVLTKIHDEENNFLLIISITTDTWRQNQGRVDQSHKDRIDRLVSLKPLNLEQIESILASRLYSLHRQANPQPATPIYPLTQQYLEAEFPSGKTNPRNALKLGVDIFQQYKEWLVKGGIKPFKPYTKTDPDQRSHSDLLANFKLKWIDEFTKVQQRVTRLRQFSSPELIQMLQEALAALKVGEVKDKFLLSPKFGSYSLSYQLPEQRKRAGVVWTEDPNMTTFFNVMNACHKTVKQNLCQSLQLIRAEGLGKSTLKGYTLYTQMFTYSPHCHIKPNLISVHYLATYYSLVKDAREGDLVVRGETLSLKKLKALVCESKVLHECPLLQDLRIVPAVTVIIEPPLKPVKDFLLNLVKTQKFLGRQTLIQNAVTKFSQVNEFQVNQLVQQLVQENEVKIINPQEKVEAQLICLVPQGSFTVKVAGV